MGVTGFFFGAFIVPLQAYVIDTADPKLRGGVWATANLLMACGWVIGSKPIYPWILKIRQNPGDVFLFCGILMFAVSLIICWRFPELGHRTIAWMTGKTGWKPAAPEP